MQTRPVEAVLRETEAPALQRAIPRWDGDHRVAAADDEQAGVEQLVQIRPQQDARADVVFGSPIGHVRRFQGRLRVASGEGATAFVGEKQRPAKRILPRPSLPPGLLRLGDRGVDVLPLGFQPARHGGRPFRAVVAVLAQRGGDRFHVLRGDDVTETLRRSHSRRPASRRARRSGPGCFRLRPIDPDRSSRRPPGPRRPPGSA